MCSRCHPSYKSAHYDVVIVGAGCSGLYASHTLSKFKKDIKVLIVEANDYVGGRVRTDDTFAPLRLPLGAEFIHEYVAQSFV